jgi:hypothetical protein
LPMSGQPARQSRRAPMCHGAEGEGGEGKARRHSKTALREGRQGTARNGRRAGTVSWGA